MALEHICNNVVHPVIGETIMKYKTIIAESILWSIWIKDMLQELGWLVQGYGRIYGTNIARFMDHAMITNIPKDRVVIYA